MKALALLLALVIGGCACSWRDISHHSETGGALYVSSKVCDECNTYRTVYVKYPEHPEKYLYVHDRLSSHPNPCMISLRVAYASDTGRTYRWNEIPHAFPPCD